MPLCTTYICNGEAISSGGLRTQLFFSTGDFASNAVTIGYSTDDFYGFYLVTKHAKIKSVTATWQQYICSLLSLLVPQRFHLLTVWHKSFNICGDQSAWWNKDIRQVFQCIFLKHCTLCAVLLNGTLVALPSIWTVPHYWYDLIVVTRYEPNWNASKKPKKQTTNRQC